MNRQKGAGAVEKGRLYAIGVGPGDPELLTLKAVRTIRNVDVIASPAKDGKPGVAYGIAVSAVPEISDKETVTLDFPMTKDSLTEAHDEVVRKLTEILSEGKNIGFLTLGDPSFYSTFSYVSEAVMKKGYDVEVINGVPSFAAVAARLRISLAVDEGSVLITSGEYSEYRGTLVIMKAGSKLKELKDLIIRSGRKAYLVENCGMENERIYKGIDEMPDRTAYFSIVVVEAVHEREPGLK